MLALHLLVVTVVTISLHTNIKAEDPQSLEVVILDLGLSKEGDICKSVDSIINNDGETEDYTKTYDVTKNGEGHMITLIKVAQTHLKGESTPKVQSSTIAGNLQAPTVTLRYLIPKEGKSTIRVEICSRVYEKNKCCGCSAN